MLYVTLDTDAVLKCHARHLFCLWNVGMVSKITHRGGIMLVWFYIKKAWHNGGSSLQPNNRICVQKELGTPSNSVRCLFTAITHSL